MKKVEKKKIEPIEITDGPNALLSEEEQFNKRWVFRDSELLLEICKKLNQMITKR